MREYKILYSYELDLLSKTVNEHLSLDWHLHGEMHIARLAPSFNRYIQIMINFKR